MPPPAFIDAHHHLWDLEKCRYPWLMARGVKRFFGDPTPIQKNYQVVDLLSESSQWVPEKSVHIQVGVDTADTVNESLWLQATADSADNGGFPHAIVAFCDLAADNAEAVLEAQIGVANVRGIRHIVGRHTEEDRLSGAPELLKDPVWQRHLSRLAGMGLSFDLQLIPPQLEDAYQLFKELPDLKVALCHCGSPWDQTKEGLENWRAGLRKLAELPNFYCKISGLSMFNHHWTLDQIRPLVLSCIDIFGPDRCMFGSNFPVDKLHTSYQAIWDAYHGITESFSGAERKQLFQDTAAAFYRLES